MSDDQKREWSRLVFEQLVDAGVTVFAYVPDAGNAAIVALAEQHNATRAVLLSSEEEGVALCAGADLAGGRAVLLMQSSGVGNCVNMLSLVGSGQFPMLLVVSMRGDYGEQNPWQYPMGQAVEPVLAAMGVPCLRVGREDELAAAVTAAINSVFKGGQATALLLSQQFLGSKPF